MTDRFGPRPTYADLPVADLAVDSSYQRSIEARRNQAAIERICENFRWSLFGIVTVTKGLTGYLIIDGQHRTEAARRLKIASVPCLIVPPLSRKDQALAFVAANRDRVAVTAFAIHHALAAAGDVSACALQAMCEAADVEVPHYPIPANKSKPSQTLAIGALRTLMECCGKTRGAELLQAIRGAFHSDTGALRAPLISALAAIEGDRRIDVVLLQKLLSRIGHKEFEKRCAAAMADGKDGQGRRTDAAVTVLTALMGPGADHPAAPPPVTKASPAPVKPAPKPYRPIPVSDGRSKPKVGPTRDELDRAISSFVATKGVTQCPPAAVAPTQADPGSKFQHEVEDQFSRAKKIGHEYGPRAGRASALANAGRRKAGL